MSPQAPSRHHRHSHHAATMIPMPRVSEQTTRQRAPAMHWTQSCPTRDEIMRLPNPYSREDTLDKLRDGLAATHKEDALALLEKAVTKAHDDQAYAHTLEEALLRGSTIELRECLGVFGDYFERSRDAFPYYPHHDAVNAIDSMLYTIKLDAITPGTLQEAIGCANNDRG